MVSLYPFIVVCFALFSFTFYSLTFSHSKAAANQALPEWVISFGTTHLRASTVATINGWGGAVVTGVLTAGGVCGGPNIAAFRLHVPVVVGVNSFVYDWNAPAVPVAPLAAIPGIVGNHINIDLHSIQQAVIIASPV